MNAAAALGRRELLQVMFPVQRVSGDQVDVIVLRLPAENLLDAVCNRDEHGRIPGPARCFIAGQGRAMRQRHGHELVAPHVVHRAHQHIERNYGQAANGGIDIKAGPFGVEVKARASISCVRWLEQSITACGPLGLVPMVYAREDRGEPIVIMRAADAMKLMRGEM